jgi:cobalamin biosynthesis Mg chelatase CobN
MRLTVISWDIYSSTIARASAGVDGIELRLFSSKQVDSSPEILEQALKALEWAQVILLYRSGENFWNDIEGLLAELGKTRPLVVLSSDPSFWSLSSATLDRVSRCYDYLVCGGRDNIKNLLRYLRAMHDPGFDEPPPPGQLQLNRLLPAVVPLQGQAPDRPAFQPLLLGKRKLRNDRLAHQQSRSPGPGVPGSVHIVTG